MLRVWCWSLPKFICDLEESTLLSGYMEVQAALLIWQPLATQAISIEIKLQIQVLSGI